MFMNELVPQQTEKHYTVKEAISRIGIDYSVLNKACKSGKCKCSEVPSHSGHGNTYLIAQSDLDYWFNNVYRARKSGTTSVQSMTIEDLAEELMRRIKQSYDDGYKAGRRDARNEFMSAFKDIK